jgi:hypothetical protein
MLVLMVMLSVPEMDVSPAAAQPVALRAAENGQGFMFRHSGTCYAVFPRHVTGPRPRAQAIAEGAASGPVSVRFPFWPDIDLAVGVVRRGAGEQCTAELEMLTGNRRAFARQGDGTLVLVDAQGQVTRFAMEVKDTNYLDFTARFTDPAVEARQGMSGAFLQVPGGLAGMAIESVDARTLRFMRIEEIGMNVERWLGTQGGVALTTRDTAQQAAPDPAKPADGPRLRLLSAGPVARSADEMAENLLSDGGAYVFEPDGPARLDFMIEGTKALSRIRMIAREADTTVLPQRILIKVNAEADGGTWRWFWSGDMPRDGVLATPARQPTRAKRVRVTLLSARGTGAIRLDRVTID